MPNAPRGLARRTLSSLSAYLRRTPGYAVLMYHRIADDIQDPWDLCVSPDNFRAQILWMKAQGLRFSTVADLVQRIEQGKDARQRVAISFDDGYADNYLSAYPILSELDIPATFFVASGYVESGREFWWDAIERLFIHPGQLPATVELSPSTEPLLLHLAGATDYSETESWIHRHWRWDDPAPTARHEAMKQAWHHLFRLSPARRDAALVELLENAGRAEGVIPSRRAMTPVELRALASDQRMEIGAHTISHPNLTVLDRAAQTEELGGSRRALEALTGREVRGLAYPNGCYDSEILDLMVEAKFRYGCRNCGSGRNAGLFELPRFIVKNAHGGALSPDVHWHAGLKIQG
ncbi:MAG: polysaccharide deacetylase [Hyphomicrobiales bacterium]|nr:polysaccharide deacetylase [Hyphomicrobiales bacterium]